MNEKIQQAIDLYKQIEQAMREAHAEAAKSPPSHKSRQMLQKLQGFETQAWTHQTELSEFLKENTPEK